MITQAGSRLIARALTGVPVQLGIGVGASDHPEHPAQGSLHGDGLLEAAWYRPCDVTFPDHCSDGSLLLQATFHLGEAEGFTWREWCIIAADEPVQPGHTLARTARGAVMVSRKTPAVPLHGGVKNNETWVLRVPLRFHLPD